MKRSIIARINENATRIMKIAAILFWIAAWHIASQLVQQKLLLASPMDTLHALLEMLRSWGFYGTVGQSLSRIALGFALGFAVSAALALAASRARWVRYLLEPPMKAARAVPVASFVIIVLIWVRSRYLSVVISFLMVAPVLYESLLTGLLQRDARLEEMAQVFRVPPMRRFRLIEAPQLAPHLRSGLKLSMGLCWKAGIAAEVIGQPQGSIGSALYQAKVFFATPELFAWTICIVLVSAALEKLVLWLFDRTLDRLINMDLGAKKAGRRRRTR